MKYVLYFYISAFRSVCAVPSVAVFCFPLISSCPGMLLRDCLSDCEMVPVASIIIGITFAFTFHMRWISIIITIVIIVVVIVIIIFLFLSPLSHSK